jgi:hypothetical protein
MTDVTVTASAAGMLDSWIDFNNDGDWDDPLEQVFTMLAVGGGILVLRRRGAN